MAIYRIFPEKDTFIQKPYRIPAAKKGEFVNAEISNAGLDPVLELSPQSRILVKFPANEVQKAINNNDIPPDDISFFIRYYLVNGIEIPENFTIDLYGVDDEWQAGTGTSLDEPPNKTGASWTNRTTEDLWPAGSEGAVGEEPNEADKIGSQSFTTPYSNLDIEIKITEPYVDKFLPPVTDKGFLIKGTNAFEKLDDDTLSPTKLYYYGRDTNTIFTPCLEIRWDDSEHAPGSKVVSGEKPFKVIIKNLSRKYHLHDVVRLDIHARLKYPKRDYNDPETYNGGAHQVNYLLPEKTWYRIRDTATREYAVEQHDDYTKVSVDSEKNYFTLFCQNLQRERIYSIELICEFNGKRQTVLYENYFKII